MKSGPHDQKSYLLESLVFSFRFSFSSFLHFILWIHNYRLLECILLFFSFCFSFFFYTCEIELKGNDFLRLTFDF